MDKIVIAGVNEYSEYVYYTIKKENNIEVVAFATLKDHINQSEFCGLPVYAVEDLSSVLDMNSCQVLLAIGYTKMNKRRENTYNICKRFGYKIYTYISSRAVCDSDEIGEGCIIMPTAYVPPCTKIGKCNIINMGTYITHTGSIGDFNWFAATIVMGGNIKMGSNCFIGMGCTLKNGITVGSEVFLGANSYLSDNATEGLAYMGSPAVNKRNLSSSIVIDFV